jgi:hypothetical protein
MMFYFVIILITLTFSYGDILFTELKLKNTILLFRVENNFQIENKNKYIEKCQNAKFMFLDDYDILNNSKEKLEEILNSAMIMNDDSFEKVDNDLFTYKLEDNVDVAPYEKDLLTNYRAIQYSIFNTENPSDNPEEDFIMFYTQKINKILDDFLLSICVNGKEFISELKYYIEKKYTLVSKNMYPAIVYEFIYDRDQDKEFDLRFKSNSEKLYELHEFNSKTKIKDSNNFQILLNDIKQFDGFKVKRIKYFKNPMELDAGFISIKINHDAVALLIEKEMIFDGDLRKINGILLLDGFFYSKKVISLYNDVESDDTTKHSLVRILQFPAYKDNSDNIVWPDQYYKQDELKSTEFDHSEIVNITSGVDDVFTIVIKYLLDNPYYNIFSTNCQTFGTMIYNALSDREAIPTESILSKDYTKTIKETTTKIDKYEILKSIIYNLK